MMRHCSVLVAGLRSAGWSRVWSRVSGVRSVCDRTVTYDLVHLATVGAHHDPAAARAPAGGPAPAEDIRTAS